MRTLLLLLLIPALIWTGARLADVERQRYALFLGMCERSEADLGSFFRCLDDIQPRTSWSWNLWYGLMD